MNTKSKQLGVVAIMTLCCLGVQLTGTFAQSPINACGTISQSGSYILTSNLSVGPAACLVVAADKVTIDLNGYTIEGVQARGGVGEGITDGSIARKNITIRNGVISKVGAGIFFAFSSFVTVDRVQVTECGSFGIFVGNHSIVKDSVASKNHLAGVASLMGNVITGNVVNENGNGGIGANQSTVSNNTVVANGGIGIEVACPSNVIGNTVGFNVQKDFEFHGKCDGTNNVLKN